MEYTYIAFIIEITIISVSLLFTIFSNVIYLKRRNNFIIRHRLPYLTLYSNILITFVVCVILYQEIAYYTRSSFTCALTLLSLHFGLIAIGEYLIIRGFYLYAIFYQQTYNTDLEEHKPVYFLNGKFRALLITVLTFLHMFIFFVQLHMKGGDYYCASTRKNCIIGTEWAFLLVHAVIVSGIILVLLNKLRKVKENLNIKTEFMISQVSICLVIVVMIPIIVWSLSRYSDSPEYIRSKLFFGVNFYYIPLVVMIHTFGTLLWPVLLDDQYTNKTWPVSKVYDERTMDEFLESKDNYITLYKIAQTYFCVELMLFWNDVKKYKENIIHKESENIKKEIYGKYIKDMSEFEINISSRRKREIKKIVKRPDVEKKIYDDALNEVLRLVLDNIYSVYITKEASDK